MRRFYARNAFDLDLEMTLDVIHGTSATNGQLKLHFYQGIDWDTSAGSPSISPTDLTLIVNAAN